jgi:beta-lactamase regulating signal transducer with metallopeptidase domain
MTAALINHLWQSTLFCGGAWLITLTLRANSASVRHWIWLLASLKFLLPFSLLFLVGSYIGLPAARIADNQLGFGPLGFGDALQSASVLVSPGALRADSGASLGALVALFAIWLGGALFVATRWLLALRAANAIVRAARPAPGAPSDARITDADIEPAVARVFHPVVLLPAALLGRLSDPEMNAVLAHEQEHITRQDNLKASIHRLVETLFWFHPVVWWIGRQMLEERERACDEAVLEQGYDGADYASGILAVCRHCRAGSAFSSAATSGDLTQRVRYILGTARPASLGVIKALSLIVATIGVATAPLFAGATHDAARRYELLTINSRTLWSAEIFIEPAASRPGARQTIIAAQNVVQIHDSTLRDLIALAYGVQRWEVYGGEWLDSPRYDLRAVAAGPVSEPDELDPHALRGLVTKLLVSKFGVEIHVNQRCQSPCGRYALAASDFTL